MANKDWTGNKASVFVCNGATGHAKEKREEHDYYATDPIAAELLLEIEPQLNNIWETACGEGNLAKVFHAVGKLGVVSDLINRNYFPEKIPTFYGDDFFNIDKVWEGDIVTNPPYACYDSETEVLTRDGWKLFKDINGSEDVLSCNIVTRQLEYSNIEKVHKYKVNEELYHFETPFIDLKVTSNHRMFCTHNKKGYIQQINNDVLKAEQIYSTSSVFPRFGYSFMSDSDVESVTIPGCFVNSGRKDVWHEEIRIPINDWLDFFGLWIADGCYRDTLNSQGNKRYTISIKQHGKTMQKAFEIVNKLPFRVKLLENKGRNSYNIEINSKQLWTYMSQFGKSHTKFIPSFIKNLPSEKLQRFLDAYMFGDCGHRKDYYILSTVSERLAWDLHEIIMKLGSFAAISKSSYKLGSGIKRNLWSISYHPAIPTMNRNAFYGKSKKEKYNGFVYCVTLKKNGFMVVRRNNKVCISGNSSVDWAQHSLDLLQEGHYLALFMKITFLEGKERKKFFAENPPIRVWVSSSRIPCAKNNEFITYKKDKEGNFKLDKNGNKIEEKVSSATCYCWYVWKKGYKGPTEIKWFN